MRTFFRRFITLAVAMLALTPSFFAQAPAPAAAATVVYVDDQVGNNVTVSCPTTGTFPTLQQGVDAAPNGATIYVCEGEYSDFVKIDTRANLKLLAKGNVRLKPTAGFTGNFLGVFDSTAITIQGFVFDGDSSLGAGDANAIGVARSSVSILKNTITRWHQPNLASTSGDSRAIFADNQTEPARVIKIDHNSIYDFQNIGIQVQYANGATITHNLLVATSSGGYSPSAISLFYATGGSIASNTIRSNSDLYGAIGSGSGLNVIETISVKMTGNTITGMYTGIGLEGQCDYSDTMKNTISGNKLNETMQGVTVGATGNCSALFQDTIISGNIFSQHADATFAIQVWSSGSVKVTGTTIKGNTFAGYNDGNRIAISGAEVAPPVESGSKTPFMPAPGA